MRRLFLVCLVAAAGSLWPGAQVALAGPSALGDFNGDGTADLAIGVPGEDVVTGLGGFIDAGAVNVLYGASGVSTAPSQLWHQSSSGVADTAEGSDNFGAAVAASDFDHDGIADLAIGAPGEDVGAVLDAGAVNVLYGSVSGLTASGNQLWSQNSTGILDFSEESDSFGESLAAGDFNGDLSADLAVGARFEDVGTIGVAGAVNVIYGSPAGLGETGNQFWHQNSAGIIDDAEPGDALGLGLAAGDFNGNGRDDLAVGAAFEDVGGAANAGAVNVIYGAASGLAAAGNQFWHQNSPGVLDASEMSDFFAALAAGDFNGDARDDLAVGAGGEAIGTIVSAGAVNVIHGSASGLTASGNQLWHQNSAGILDAAEQSDFFGSSLVGGNFNGDLRDDLALGVPGEGVGTGDGAGAVNVIYGGTTGLTATGNQFWSQNSPGILGSAVGGDAFGSALAAGDFDGDLHADMAVGAPGDEGVGAVNVIYGGAARLSASGNQLWNQNSPGIPETAESNDRFGDALASGDSQFGE